MTTLRRPGLLMAAPLLISLWAGCQAAETDTGTAQPTAGSAAPKGNGSSGGSGGKDSSPDGTSGSGGSSSQASSGSTGDGSGGNGGSSDSNPPQGGSAATMQGGGGDGGAYASGGSGATAAAGSGGSGGSGTTDPGLSDPLFDQETVQRFDITLPQASIDMLAPATDGTIPDQYVTGSLQYNDITVDNIGVRIKGEASRRPLTKKAAFKLKLDEYVSKQNLLGLRRITLNNMLSDATFMAECLSYALFRAANLPAPRCNHALVYVNGDFYGLYANVESEDKTFLSRWFASNDGNLYEEGQVDFKPNYEQYFDLETNETLNDRSDLTALINALEQASDATYLADMDSILDTAQFLKYTAFEGAVNQWDGYSYTYFEPNNFRIYDDPTTGKFSFIPWGMDLSLKPHPYSQREYLPMFSVPIYEDKPDARDSGGRIFVRCLGSDSCKAQYAQTLRDAISVYEATDLPALAAKFYALIKDHVAADTRKEIMTSDFEAAYQALLTHLQARAGVMRDDMTAAGFTP